VKAIASCDIFVILITEAVAASQHVLRELEQAAKQKKAMLPIIVDQVASDDIDYYLGAVQRITGSPEEVVEQTYEYFSKVTVSTPHRESSAQPPQSRPVCVPLCEADVPTILRVGIIPFPPFSDYSAAQESFSGYYLDLLDELAREHSLNISYVAITNEDTVRVLADGEVDFVACLYRTPRRQQMFDFAACFFASTVGAIVRADESRIATHGDLMQEEIRIAVCQGEIGAELAADQFLAKRGSRRLIEVDTVEVANISGLVAARVADVAITDNITCQMLVSQTSDSLRHIFGDFPLFVGHIGLVLPQGRPKLVDFLNCNLMEIRRRERFRERETQLIRDHSGVLQAL
jgi:hypothetical protein